MLTSAISLILSAAIKLLLGYIQQQQANANAVALGSAQTASTINKETADAERRAADVAINAPDRARVTDDADLGKF